MKFRGKRALRVEFPGDTSIAQVRIITRQDGEIDVEGPVSEDEAATIFKLAAGTATDTRAEEAAVVEAALARHAAEKQVTGATWGLVHEENEKLEKACDALLAKKKS